MPWETKEFLPWIHRALDGAEKTRLARREFLAREAGFSDPAVRKFVNDAKYPGASKAAVAESGAEGLAWGANKLKASRGAVKGGMGIFALFMFYMENRRSDAEFARAVAELKKGKQEMKT